MYLRRPHSFTASPPSVATRHDFGYPCGRVISGRSFDTSPLEIASMHARACARYFALMLFVSPTIAFLAASNIAIAADDASKAIPGIGPTGPAKEIAGTFKFTEGPATDKNGVVYFTDATKKVYKIEPDNSVSVVREDSNGANGLMFNAAGEIVGCQMNGVVAWNPKTKEERVLADTYDGKPLNRPNDLVVDNGGGVYFTDPKFSLNGKPNQPVNGVFYVTDGGLDDHKLTRLDRRRRRPQRDHPVARRKDALCHSLLARADDGLSGPRAG